MIGTVFLFALLQVTVPDAQQFVGAPKAAPLTGAALERRTNEVAALVRCPVCQGMSVADSPSTVALDMKQQIHDLLARGYTQEQILDYFEHSYGQFVLLRPKIAIVWILPLLALIIGVVVVFAKLRKLEKPAAGDPQPATDTYVDRVRQLVNGE